MFRPGKPAAFTILIFLGSMQVLVGQQGPRGLTQGFVNATRQKSSELPPVLPRTVVAQWMRDRLKADRDASRTGYFYESRLNGLVGREEMLASLDQAVQEAALNVSNFASPIQAKVSSILFLEPDKSQDELRRTIAAKTSAAGMSTAQIAVFGSNIASIRARAEKSILDPAKAEGIKSAKAAAEDLRRELQKRMPNSDLLKRSLDSIQTVLTDAGRQYVDNLTSSSNALVGYAKVADLASALSNNKHPGQLPAIAPKEAADLLAWFGRLDRAQANFKSAFNREQTKRITDGLEADLNKARSNWETAISNYKDGSQVLRQYGVPVPPAVSNVGTFVTEFVQVRDMLNGGISGLGDPKAAALVNLGVSKGIVSPEVAKGLGALMSAKGDYASAVLGIASALNVNPPNEVKQLLPIAMTAASLFSGAGPLMALGGFGGGGGPLGAMAGLSGGGGADYSRDFAEMKAQLAEMNNRLKRIEQQLNQISADIARNHQEVMIALESLSYDVYRTHELLAFSTHASYHGTCLAAAPQLVETSRKDSCNTQMQILSRYAVGTGVPEALTARANYGWKSGESNSALAIQRRENSVRQFIARVFDRSKVQRNRETGALDAGEKEQEDDCSGLTNPAYNLVDLQKREAASFLARTQSAILSRVPCGRVVARRQELIEAGMLVQYVNAELDALLNWPNASRQTLDWWTLHGEEIQKRWQITLALLDDAISQQSLMTGDVTLASLAHFAENSGNFATAEKAKAAEQEQNVKTRLTQVEKDAVQELTDMRAAWGTETASLLAENVARYWVWERLKNSNAPRMLYAMASAADDVRLWISFLNLRNSAVTMDKDKGTWYVTFPGLPVRVPLPQSGDWVQFQLRWPNTLTELVAARKRLREELANIAYMQSLRAPNAPTEMFEALVFSMAQ